MHSIYCSKLTIKKLISIININIQEFYTVDFHKYQHDFKI